jgi:hypothetical protein
MNDYAYHEIEEREEGQTFKNRRKGGGSNLQNSFLKGFCPQRVDNTG